MSGLTFHETMSGPVALGETDPQAGAASPAAAELAIHCEITIDDIDRFVDDPEHTGTIAGTVDYAPFGDGIPATQGIFNLFSPGGPGEKIMEYRLGFEHDGTAYYLVGKKHVHDDPGFDVWKYTTTLLTVVHAGSDESGAVPAAGALTLGVVCRTRMVA